MTSLFPHAGNKQFIIPKRFGLIPNASAHKVTSILVAFDGVDVDGTAVTTGFSVLQDSTPVAVVSAVEPGPNEILVSHDAVALGVKTTLHYDGSGDWRGDNGYIVGPFTLTGVTV